MGFIFLKKEWKCETNLEIYEISWKSVILRFFSSTLTFFCSFVITKYNKGDFGYKCFYENAHWNWWHFCTNQHHLNLPLFSKHVKSYDPLSVQISVWFQKKLFNEPWFEITEKVRKSLDSGRFACGIFVDLQKAFDTVNHDILLNKLEHYGLLGTS